jgi:hypothetical protein
MDQVTDPCAGFLNAQAPLLLFLELGNQFIHNVHSEGFGGRAPMHRLSHGGQ